MLDLARERLVTLDQVLIVLAQINGGIAGVERKLSIPERSMAGAAAA